MPCFTYSLGHRRSSSHEKRMILADDDSARFVAKNVARAMAARELEIGSLDLSQELSVTDESGNTIHTLPLRQAVRLSGL